MQNYLEFEKPLAEIEGKAEELRAMARANSEMDVEFGERPVKIPVSTATEPSSVTTPFS